MKSIRLLFAFAMILAGLAGIPQTATLLVSGHVTEMQTGFPVGSHMVALTVFGDSINFPVPFTDSTLTDPTGLYSITLTIPYTPGTAAFLTAGTYDCTMNWLLQSFVYTNTQSSFTANFSICTDTIIPPSPCANYISLVGLQGLTASFQGSVINGLAASYFWQMGDGTTSTIQNPTHTYAQQGIYNVTLQTLTPGGCSDTSDFILVLMDSIPGGCASWFIATPAGNPREMAFTAITQSQFPTDFTWDLGDGNTATGQNPLHTYCCDGTYMVVLTATDTTGCSSTFAAPILVVNDSTANLTLSGQVLEGNVPINFGMVSLVGVGPAGAYYPVQTTFIDSVGLYNFWNVSNGTYLILAYPPPDSLPGGNQFLPTYYGDVVFWEQAIPVTLGVPFNPYIIHLVSFDSIGGGGGSVGGQLLGGGKSISAGGQEVLLLDAYGNPVRITYTDPEGRFSFTSLPFGQYKVNPVITGITVQTAPFVLSATNPSAVVLLTINGNIITGLNKNKESGLITGVYPNPAADQVSLMLNAIGNVEIIIVNASGQLVISETRILSGNGSRVTIPVNNLKPGLYMILVKDKEGVISSSRIIKN